MFSWGSLVDIQVPMDIENRQRIGGSLGDALKPRNENDSERLDASCE